MHAPEPLVSSPDIQAQFLALQAENARLSEDNTRLRIKSNRQARKVLVMDQKSRRQDDEIARLHKHVAYLQEQHMGTPAGAERVRMKAREEELLQLLDFFRRLLFGPKSERHGMEATPDPNQKTLFGDSLMVPHKPETDVASPARKRRPRSKRRLVLEDIPSWIPHEVHTLNPEGDHSKLKCIGEETTWFLEYVPATFKVVMLKRPKYVDPKKVDGGVIVADLPPRIIPKGNAGPGLLAHMIVSKYLDHLPLHRQLQGFSRHGMHLASSTVGGWVNTVADRLTPLYDQLTRALLASGYVQADETTMPVLDRTKKGKTHRGYQWTYLAPEVGLVVMNYSKTRKKVEPATFLNGFEGALQSDGYAGYSPFEECPSITTYACMAHARRMFVRSLISHPKEADRVLAYFQQLYAIVRH